MCVVIRWLINGHITALPCVCLCVLYACFNMPLIIGAVICSFITPYHYGTLSGCCGCMCVI